MSQKTIDMLASALRNVLVPTSRISQTTLESAYKTSKMPAGIGRNTPGEVLYARLALAQYDKERREAAAKGGEQ